MAVELATAYIALVPETSKIAPGVRKALGGVERDADKTGQTMGSRISGGLKKSLKVGAAAAGGILAAGLGVALTKGLGRLTAIENAQAKMRGLGHDTETVDAIMKNALASVKGTAFGLGEAATTAAGAVAAGIKPGKELEGVLASVANSAAASGSSMEEMGSIYNKAASLGKAQNDILQQVADRGIPIYQALAEQMGVTSEEVFKLASEGKVSFEQFEGAMTQASGTVAEEMGKTFTGSLSNMWAAFGRIGANLLSGVFEKFAPAIQGVTGWLSNLEPVATKVGEAIGVFAAKVTDGASALFDLLVKGDFTGKFREAFGVEEDHPFVGFLFGVRDAALAVFGYFQDTVIPAIQNFFAEFRAGEGAGGKFRDVLDAIWEKVKGAFGYVQDNVIPAIQTFITEFRNGEGAGGKFRDVLSDIWAKAQDAFGYVKDTVIPALEDLWDWLKKNEDIVIAVGAAVLGYKGYLIALEIWTKAVTIATTIWTGVQKALNLVMKLNPIGLLIAAITALVAVVIYAYKENETFRKIVDTAWAGIKAAIDVVVRWFKDTAWPWMKDTFDKLRTKMGEVKDRIVGAWDSIKAGISSGWDFVKGVFDKFKSGLSSLRDRFTSIKNGIRDIWSNLTSAIAGPIRKVVQFINDKFLKPLENALNKIPGVSVSLPRIPVPSVPNSATAGGSGRAVAMLAAGGHVPGWSPHDRADNIPAMLTAGEYVLPVGATRSLASRFGPDFLEQLRRGLPGYATGGLIGGRGNEQPGASRTGNFLAKGWEWLVDIVKDAGGWVRRTFDNLLGGIGSSWPAQVAKGAIGGTADKLAAFIKDNIFGGSAGGGGAGRVNYGGGYGQHPTGMHYEAIWAMIKAVVPNAIRSSTYRPGAVTASGIPSLHGLGRAVDWYTPGMAGMNEAFRKVGALMKWSQHFYTPAGSGLQQGYVDDIIRRTHRDHAHTALADGGLVKPFVADSGALLAPGINVLNNKTGGPEPLGRLDRELDLSDTTLARFEGMMRRVAIEAVREENRLARMGG